MFYLCFTLPLHHHHPPIFFRMGTSFTGLRCTSDSRNFGIDVTPWDTASSAKFWALVATCRWKDAMRKMIVLHIVSSIHNMEMEIQEKFEGDTNAYMKLKWNWCNYVQLFKVHMRSRTENPIESIVRNGDLTSIMDVRSSHEANPRKSNYPGHQHKRRFMTSSKNCAMDLFSANQGSQVCIHPAPKPPGRNLQGHMHCIRGLQVAKVLAIHKKCPKHTKTLKNIQKMSKNIEKLHSSIFAIEKLTCSVPNLQNSIAFVAASPVLAST